MEISATNKQYVVGVSEKEESNKIIINTKQTDTTKSTLIDKNKLSTLLNQYIDKYENYNDFDIELENQLLDLGVNSIKLNNLKNELLLYQTDDNLDSDFTIFVNFSINNWIDELSY